MKRAGVLSESSSLDQPRRSKRLAKTNTKNASVAAPSVVSISSNEGSSNNTRRVANNTKAPPAQVIFRNFPQDAIQKVNAMLPIFAEYMDDAATDSDDATSHIRQVQYIQMKECIFRICKFALLEKSFLGKDQETRQMQASAMNTLIYPCPTSSNDNTKEFELVENFVQVIIARGNILPPKSLYLFQQSHDELVQEMNATLGKSTSLLSDKIMTFQERLTTFLILQGEKLLELHNSKIQIANYLFRHDAHKLSQTVNLLCVQRAIVQVWIHLLKETESYCWNSCDEMRMEQLENAHASFVFCRNCLLSTEGDLQSLDVKMMLWKLALYCSYAMDWPSDTCTLHEKDVLKRLGTMVRR